jgi:hypothetical protein
MPADSSKGIPSRVFQIAVAIMTHLFSDRPLDEWRRKQTSPRALAPVAGLRGLYGSPFDAAMNVTFRPATRHATDGYRFLKWVGERIAKRYLTVARLDNKLSTPAAVAWSFGIFAILLSIYAFSPVAASGDSRWSSAYRHEFDTWQ